MRYTSTVPFFQTFLEFNVSISFSKNNDNSNNHDSFNVLKIDEKLIDLKNDKTVEWSKNTTDEIKNISNAIDCSNYIIR